MSNEWWNSEISRFLTGLLSWRLKWIVNLNSDFKLKCHFKIVCLHYHTSHEWKENGKSTVQDWRDYKVGGRRVGFSILVVYIYVFIVLEYGCCLIKGLMLCLWKIKIALVDNFGPECKLHFIIYAFVLLCFFDFQVDCLIQDHSHGIMNHTMAIIPVNHHGASTTNVSGPEWWQHYALENMKVRYFVLFFNCLCRWVLCSCRWEWECFYPDILLQRNQNCKILS